MSYQNEWLLFEAEDEFDEIEHREPTEELLFYRAVASGDVEAVKKIYRMRWRRGIVKECSYKYEISFCHNDGNDHKTLQTEWNGDGTGISSERFLYSEAG